MALRDNPDHNDDDGDDADDNDDGDDANDDDDGDDANDDDDGDDADDDNNEPRKSTTTSEAPHDEGAPNDDEEGAPPPPIRYNLRPHPIATRRFNHAIDEPHSGQGTTRLHNYYNDGVLQGTKIQHRHIKDNAALRKMVFGLVMTQMSAKAGIRKHGAAAEAAMMAEFTQLEDLGAYESIDPDTLDLGPKER
jgi:hypothetical protein